MKKYIICMFITLWALTGCSSSTEAVLRTGISKSDIHWNIDQGKGNLNVYTNESELISDVDKKRINFGYVHLDTAAEQYMKGKAIVAIAGFTDNQKNIWVLITSPDQIRTNRQSVQDAVHIFLTYANQNGYTQVDLDENTLKQNLNASNKVNLSWFVDRSFAIGKNTKY